MLPRSDTFASLLGDFNNACSCPCCLSSSIIFFLGVQFRGWFRDCLACESNPEPGFSSLCPFLVDNICEKTEKFRKKKFQKTTPPKKNLWHSCPLISQQSSLTMELQTVEDSGNINELATHFIFIQWEIKTPIFKSIVCFLFLAPSSLLQWCNYQIANNHSILQHNMLHNMVLSTRNAVH